MATTVYKTGATRHPSGMTADRNGMDFTFGWKVMDENHGGGQAVSWHTNVVPEGTWFPAEVTASDTSVTVSPVPTSYYPYTDKELRWISLIVRGKRSQTSETSGDVTTVTNYTWSEWENKVFRISPPSAPELTQELQSIWPVCRYSWSVETADNDEKPYHSVEWQALRVKESSEIDGSRLRWAATSTNDFRSGTSTNTSGDIDITEDSGDLAQGSWTRWVRMRSRGPGGASAWRYVKHVFAKPWAATINQSINRTTMQRAQTYATTTARAISVRVEWTAYSVSAHPIDHVVVQYLIDTPAEGMALPASPRWVDALTVADSRETDAAEFLIDGRIEEDRCLWVRVVTVHDVHEIPSREMLLAVGELAAPEFSGTVSLDYTEKKATISVVHNSEVTDSRIAVYFHKNEDTPFICSIIERGQDPKVIPLNWFETTDNLAFSLVEFQGTASVQTRSYTVAGVTYTYNRYTLDTNMVSDRVQGDGNVPVAPTGVKARYQQGAGVSASKQADSADVLVDWNWNWYSATAAEVSWSQNPHAWESTDPPASYEVDRMRPSQIYVSGLERGVTWYFRVRFLRATDDATTYGPYSGTVRVTIAETPEAPTTGQPSPSTVADPSAMAAAASSLVRRTGWVQLNWQYVNTDGTTQRYAEVREVAVGWNATLNEQTITFVQNVGKVYTPHRLFFQPSALPTPWTSGTTHYLQVRVTSSAGLVSDWSNPVAVNVADPVSCVISASSLVTEEGRKLLTAIPMTVTVTGAGAGDTTKVAIERYEDYTVIRPDETEFRGTAGETVYSDSHLGAGAFTVRREDLTGTLDDHAWYRLAATVEDTFGQSKTVYQVFQVAWSHQPVRPEGSVVMDGYEAVITPALPDGVTAETGDCVDIYRLSADRPEAIVLGGEWGKSYRDPYPAIGEMGGHRIVYRSANGDVFDADSRAAWTDLRQAAGDYLDSVYAIIDFDKFRIETEYNMDLSSSWEKDFTETRYLGGSVQGDWNPAVRRSSTVNAVAVPMDDVELIRNFRRLAVWPGICHVRTPDGSSFAADIQVSESRSYQDGGKIAEFTLTITRVDPETLDGEEVE